MFENKEKLLTKMHKALVKIGAEGIIALARILVIDARDPNNTEELKSFDQIYPEALEKFSSLPMKKQKEIVKVFEKAAKEYGSDKKM